MNQNTNVYPNLTQNANNNAFYNNVNATKFSVSPQNLNFIPHQYSIQNTFSGMPTNSAAAFDNNQLNAASEKNKQEAEKRNLKARSVIQEILQDTEISMNQSGKDYEKNSNLYLCNSKFFNF